MRLRPALAVNLLTGERRAVNELGQIVAMAGIGHPPRFFATLAECGATLKRSVALADHQALAQKDVDALLQPGETLVMTEKDAVKCRPFAQANWWYLPVDAELAGDAAEKLLLDLLTLVR